MSGDVIVEDGSFMQFNVTMGCGPSKDCYRKCQLYLQHLYYCTLLCEIFEIPNLIMSWYISLHIYHSKGTIVVWNFFHDYCRNEQVLVVCSSNDGMMSYKANSISNKRSLLIIQL